jgi:hypothetical protein
MATYTVTQVSDGVRDWQTKAGVPWKSYRVALRNADGRELGNVEWSRPASEPTPKLGEATPADATVDTKAEYGPKLVLPKKGGGGGGGWKPKPPEERRSIAMQHAQKCAVTILQAADPEFEVSTQEVVDTAWVLFRQVLAAETQDRASA